MSPFRRFSRRFWPLHAYLMVSMILWPVPPARSYWTDSNQDGVKEWVDEAGLDPAWWDADSDDDGLTNAQEAVYGSDPYAKDSDRDGLSDLVERDYTPPSAPFDPWSWDTDGDGYSDHDEYYLLIQGSPLVVHYPSLGGIYYDYRDADGDGVLNYEDSDPTGMDRDGDGLPNWEDSWMDDASNGYVPPAYDPGVYIGGTWYPSGTMDSDSDGIPDHLDPFPWGSFWYNGIEYGGSWSDRDADGIPDSADTYPDGSYWYEGVEYGGTWSDMDGDGIPDPADPSPVYVESYWYGGTEYLGTWQDTDGDGIPDPADEYMWDSWNGQPHFNYNGTEYPGESVDRDGDGVPDVADSWPDDPENGADDDNDGLCNYDERTQHFTDPHDVDSDNDWLTDYEELYVFQTNPKAPRSALASGQTLLDGQIHLGADADGDELPDVLEDYYASLGYGLDKNDPADGAGDLDSDGHTNAQAFTYGWSLIANRGTYDQDADGIDDAVEAYWAAVYPGSMDKTVFEDAVADHDQDGLMNYEEVVRHNVNGWLLPADPGDAYSLMRSQGYEVVPGVTPNDGQFLRWWWDVDRPDYGGTVDGTPVPADAALRDVTDVDPAANGLPDGYERWVAANGEGSNTARAILADEDGDGMPNVWEYRYGLNLRGPQDATINPDGDSLTNLQEFQAGRDPWVDDDAPPDDLLFHGSLPAEGAIGVSYTGNLSASGGEAPLVFTVSSGDLPPGLALNSATGQVTGTPTQDGSFNVFITVTDALGTTAVSSWGITVAGLEISTASLPVAYLGRTYNASINARFGSSPYQFSLVYPSELPHGYGMDSAGKITSDGFVDPLFPVVAGDYPFDVQVWDSSGRTTTKTLTLTLEEPPPPPALIFTSMVLPPGTVAWDYHAQVPVTGVQGGATYGLVGAPAWLAVNGSGHLSGKPTATGQFTFDVWVQDEIWDPITGMNRRAVQTMSLSVAPYLPAHVTIISGNLQIRRANATFDPIVVMVTDDNGAAMPGIPVTALGITLLTDATGLATFTLPAFGTVGAQEVEVASPAEVATVHFYTYDPPGTGQPPLSSDVPKPSAPEMKPQVAQPEAQLECRYVSTSSGTIEAQWNEAWVYFVDMLKVWQLVPGVPVPDVNKSGLKWATSDGREGPPPDDVPSLESITTWFPGNPAAMYSIAADKTGVLEGVPNPGGTGPATPIPPNVESHPLYGNWGGTQKGFEEKLVADVRLTHTSGSGSGEVKQTFLEIVEEDGQITSATPITLSTSDSQPHRLEAPKPPTGKRNKKYLLPIEVMQPIDSASPGEPVATSSLRMSRWFGNVRQSGSDTYDLSQLPNQDHDRIKLRIPIPSKKGQSPVTVRVSTQNCGEGFNTSPTEMELEETSANSGVFESKFPFILVADAEDDGAQYGSPSVGDGAKNDRTILARPGGKLVVQIPDLSNASIEVSIAPYRHFIEVEAVILNNQNDPWVGAGQATIVNSQIEAMKSAYAPFGIRIVPHVQTITVSNHSEIVAAYADGKIDVTDPELAPTWGLHEYPQIISRLDQLGYKTERNVVLFYTDVPLKDHVTGGYPVGTGFREYPGWACVNMIAASATQRKYLSAHEFGHLLGLLHDGTEGGNGPQNSPMTRMMTVAGGNGFTGSPSTTGKRLSRADGETMKQSEYCQPITP